MREVVIISAARTPIGKFGGALSSLSAVEMGTLAAKAVLKRANVDPVDVDEVLIGNVLSSGLGQNPARQIAIHSGLSKESTAMTLNMVCGSGLRAIALAAQSIMLGDSEVVLAGGAECMSAAPYILPKARWGQRMGDGTLVDTMVYDGLMEVFNQYHMGVTAENVAELWGISREEQDQFALTSQSRANEAICSGRFKEEIVLVEVPQRKGAPILVDTDEYPRAGTTLEGLGKLRPAFKKNGTVTAGNASGVNDGAAMLILMSAEKAESLGLEPLARIKSYASAGLDPTIMGYGPVPATKKALDKAGIQIEDLDLVEANEAFASQSLAVLGDLGLDPSIVNVNGGAIALGHPIGASGARILVTLVHEMIKRDSKRGLATLCIGGGMGTAVVIER